MACLHILKSTIYEKSPSPKAGSEVISQMLAGQDVLYVIADIPEESRKTFTSAASTNDLIYNALTTKLL